MSSTRPCPASSARVLGLALIALSASSAESFPQSLLNNQLLRRFGSEPVERTARLAGGSALATAGLPEAMAMLGERDSAAARRVRIAVARWRAAARAAHSDSAGLDTALSAVQRIPTFAERLLELEREAIRDTTVSTLGALALATTASNPTEFESVKTVLQNAGATQDQLEIVELHARNLADALRRAERRVAFEPTIIVYAQGDVKGFRKGDVTEDEFKGTGALGVGFAYSHYTLGVTINVASTLDTATAEYASFILTPSVGRLLSSALATWRGRLSSTGGPTLNMYGGFSSTVWRKGDSRQSVTVAPVGVLLQLISRSVGDGENAVEALIDAGASARFLTGNLAANRDSLQHFLGQRRTVYWGPEIGLQVSFNRIVAAAHYYYYFSRRSAHVTGLTRGQLVGGISLAGELLTLRRRRNPS